MSETFCFMLDSFRTVKCLRSLSETALFWWNMKEISFLIRRQCVFNFFLLHLPNTHDTESTSHSNSTPIVNVSVTKQDRTEAQYSVKIHGTVYLQTHLVPYTKCAKGKSPGNPRVGKANSNPVSHTHDSVLFSHTHHSPWQIGREKIYDSQGAIINKC